MLNALAPELLRRAALHDEAHAHTPRYACAQAQIARDLYYYHLGRERVVPPEWRAILQTLFDSPEDLEAGQPSDPLLGDAFFDEARPGAPLVRPGGQSTALRSRGERRRFADYAAQDREHAAASSAAAETPAKADSDGAAATSASRRPLVGSPELRLPVAKTERLARLVSPDAYPWILQHTAFSTREQRIRNGAPGEAHVSSLLRRAPQAGTRTMGERL
jgi:hypothetical protein